MLTYLQSTWMSWKGWSEGFLSLCEAAPTPWSKNRDDDVGIYIIFRTLQEALIEASRGTIFATGAHGKANVVDIPTLTKEGELRLGIKC